VDANNFTVFERNGTSAKEEDEETAKKLKLGVKRKGE